MSAPRVVLVCHGNWHTKLVMRTVSNAQFLSNKHKKCDFRNKLHTIKKKGAPGYRLGRILGDLHPYYTESARLCTPSQIVWKLDCTSPTHQLTMCHQFAIWGPKSSYHFSPPRRQWASGPSTGMAAIAIPWLSYHCYREVANQTSCLQTLAWYQRWIQHSGIERTVNICLVWGATWLPSNCHFLCKSLPGISEDFRHTGINRKIVRMMSWEKGFLHCKLSPPRSTMDAIESWVAIEFLRAKLKSFLAEHTLLSFDFYLTSGASARVAFCRYPCPQRESALPGFDTLISPSVIANHSRTCGGRQASTEQ